MSSKCDELIDDLTRLTIKQMFNSQSFQINTKAIQVHFKKNYASLLSNQIELEDNSQVRLESTLCDLLHITSKYECSNKLVTQRVRNV